MRSDFKPVHLQKANKKLDAYVLPSVRYQKEDGRHSDENAHSVSLWKKFLGLFKTRPSRLPGEF